MRSWLWLILSGCSAAAQAGSLVDVEVVDRESGTVLPVYAQHTKQWIAGMPGHRYSVRLVNQSGERVLAVLSVDGVNAVSGETASTQQTGYVLEPWQRTEISGWRKDMSQVAAFEFTALSNSYAARTGRPGNVGVIGVAVFRERRPVHPGYDYEQSIGRQAERPRREAPASSAGAPASSSDSMARGPVPPSPAPQESLGTGHGAREWSHARQVAFERESTSPFEVIALNYDSYPNLVAMGVIAQPYRRGAPDPFPIGFVPDP